ncbi:MAG: hypothetical protein LAT77_09815 [Aliidiomarina sp.]|uniref:hypothetical protein n=1 Tax=Aliidiomarina sp. TaxID=1872439 RepID=UPI0025C46A2B|nr:hypothetical protein [Aliidiomarina sp.]MCH8502189.1 hypothetical protein [Aliidiomarina sp.]
MLKRLLPIIGVTLVILVLALGAFFSAPDDDTSSQRPQVWLEWQYDESNRLLTNAAEDLNYRLQTHHEYRLAASPDVASHRVHVELQLVNTEQLVIRGRLGDRLIVVDGPSAVWTSLVPQFFRLLNEEIQQQTD